MPAVAEETRQLLRGAATSLATQIAGAAFAFSLQIVIARALGVSGFGVYSFVGAICSPLVLLAGFGLPTVVIRLAPSYREQANWPLLKGLLVSTERIALFLSFAVAAGGSALALGLASHPLPYLIGIWTLPLTVWLRVTSELARALGHYGLAFVLPLVQPAVILAAAVVSLRLLGGLAVWQALLLPATGMAVMLPIQRTLLHRGVNATLPAETTAAIDLRAWLSLGAFFLLINGSNMVLNGVDQMLLGSMRGSRSVALFSAADYLSNFSMWIMIAVGASVVPAFASAWARGDKEHLEFLALRAVRWAFYPQLAVALLLAALAPLLLASYGAGFRPARWALCFRLAGQLANTSTGYIGCLMNMTGRERQAARSIGVFAVLNIVAAVVGIELAGYTGAAASTALALLAWNLWLLHLVHRHVGIGAAIWDDWKQRLRRRAAA